MSRTPPTAAPPALPPEADKARIVCRYKGAQILDAREHVRIALTGTPPRGVKGFLRSKGFRPTGPNGEWQRQHSPIATMTAQAICRAYFQPEENT